MSLLSEDFKTVIECQNLSVESINSNELTTNSMITSHLVTSDLIIADPLNSNDASTLSEIGNVLTIKSYNPLGTINVNIEGDVTVSGSMVVQTNVISPTITWLYGSETRTLTFLNGLLQTYTVI